MSTQMTLERYARAVRLAAATMLILGGLLSAPAAAQPYPSKPIRMVIPWAAGGGADNVGRELARRLTAVLGQPVIVDNRPGANGTLGANVVAHAAPDGYTMMLTAISSHIASPFIYSNLPYDAFADFAPVTEISSESLLFLVNPSFSAKDIADLVRLAKAQPGTINFASFGTGSPSHLAGELLKSMTNIDLVHVPYKSGAPALSDVIAGHIPIFISGFSSAVPHVKAGRVRALATTGSKRVKALPDVPTLAETPGLERYEVIMTFAVWVPARTPADIIAKLNAAITTEIRTPEFRQFPAFSGLSDPIGNTPEQMAATLVRERAKLGELLKAAGVQAEFVKDFDVPKAKN